jgi:hypothetical protein
VPNLGEGEVRLLPVPLEGGTGELGALPPPLGFEAGVGRPLREEAAIGGLQVPEALLEGHAGDFPQPGRHGLLLPPGQGRARLRIVDLGLILGVTVLSERKRPVVNVPHAAKGLGQKAPLGRTRVKPEAVAGKHGKTIKLDMSYINKNQPSAIPFRPEERRFLVVTG